MSLAEISTHALKATIEGQATEILAREAYKSVSIQVSKGQRRLLERWFRRREGAQAEFRCGAPEPRLSEPRGEQTGQHGRPRRKGPAKRREPEPLRRDRLSYGVP